MAAGVLRGSTLHQIVELNGGWKRNKQNNLGTGAAFGEAVGLVPADVATEAALIDDVSILTRTEYQTFVEGVAIHGEPVNSRKAEPLTALKAERDLIVARGGDTTAIDAEIDKSLDPDDPTPGVRKNTNRETLAEYEARTGDTVV